jgi:hypothetical protein
MKSLSFAGLALTSALGACAGTSSPSLVAADGGEPAESDAGAPEVGGPGPPSQDARGEAGAPAADAATAAAAVNCGKPPYSVLRLAARNLMAPADQRELGNVKITLGLCPGVQTLTQADGKAQINLTEGAETWIRFEATGFLPCLFGEFAVSASASTPVLSATMIPDAAAPGLLPGYRADRPLIYVQVQAGRSTAPDACRARDGVALAVKDHPEAMVLYRGIGSNAAYVSGKATTTEGTAIIVGLIAATTGSVQVQATKSGCTYTAAYGDANSAALLPILRTPLAKGALTYLSINPMR